LDLGSLLLDLRIVLLECWSWTAASWWFWAVTLLYKT
jgi:hypothetical protein